MKNLFIFTVILSSAVAGAANNFQIFKDIKLEKPTFWRKVKSDEFKVNRSRSVDCIYGSQAVMDDLGKFFQENTAGQKTWENLTKEAATVINKWALIKRGYGKKRYIYCSTGLKPLALVYYYSGHKLLGEFIRRQLITFAGLPMEFWLHSELRGYQKNNPKGALETAGLSLAMSVALSLAPQTLSSIEMKQVRTALQRKGLVPLLNWLSTLRKHNWTAVIGAGAYVTAKYFADTKAMYIAEKSLSGYLNGVIEKDGSYGEGVNYFNYPIKTIFPAILCMSESERHKLLANAPLHGSARWLVYHYLYKKDDHNRMLPLRVSFGDNMYYGSISPEICSMLAIIYKEGLATWLGNAFRQNSSWWEDDWKIQLLILKIGKLPAPKSPADIKLPLIKSFNNGENFIRSSWKPNSIVMSMYSPQIRTLSGYSHQRPERNSIALGAFGEYLIVSPGSASYRSPLHKSWDLATRSANTITIDDKNQLFPFKNNKLYPHFVYGRPQTKLLCSRENKDFAILVCDAAKAYAPQMKHALRAIIYVKKHKYFLMIDYLQAQNTSHKFTWRLHFNNHDGKGTLKQLTPGNWLFSRPLASLAVYHATDQPSKTEVGKGYMHGRKRDYSPGGKYEGKLGSSIELNSFNTKPEKELTFISVLQPLKSGNKALPVSLKQNEIKIGDDIYRLIGGKLITGSETFQLW